ncbi:MAG: NTP transferase domain-containing protein [Myxococcota bacterium]
MNAYVLAGGASQRMGSDKARLPHEGRPAAVFLVELLASVGLEVALVRRGEPEALPWVHDDGSAVRVVREADSGPRHPLNGVVSALEDAGGPVLIVPCDVLHLSRDALERLAAAPGVAAAGDDVHPLVAHLPASLLEEARRLVDRGGRAHDLVASLPRIPLPASELLDRNTSDGPWPMDLLRARLSWVDEAGFARIARSERIRQRARGVVDPSANRYALPPREGSQHG